MALTRLSCLLVVCVFIAAEVTFLAPALLAQSAGTGALTGTVTDPSGAAIPNATVTLTNTETGQVRSANTASDGSYRFGLLPPGTYRVRFSAMGFKVAEVTSVQVDVAETPVLNRALEVGGQSETIQVQAEAAALRTADTTLGTTVGTRTVTELPLANRNYTQILGLSAGVAVSVNNATSFGKGTLDMAVNGNDTTQNNFQMDGVNITNFATSGSAGDQNGLYTGIGIPNPDAIQEFKIQTSTYDASYGRNPGANVNVVTKSGTNSWHGIAFEFFRNAQLNANDFFYNRDGCAGYTAGSCPKQILNQNQFGGTLGGPIKKDKLFIFGSYGETRSRNGVAAEGKTSALLPPIPAGDRSAPGFAAALAAENCGNSTFAPLAAFTQQLKCDGSNVNPVALKILQLKNADGSYFFKGSGTPNYQQTLFSDPAVFQENQVIVNGDYLLNSKNTIAGRYFYSRDPQIKTLNGTMPGAPETDYYSNVYSLLKLTSIVTNSLVNEARVSYQRNFAYSSFAPPAGSSPQSLGITPSNPAITLPPYFINSALWGGPNLFALGPTFAPANQFQYADQISWSHGKHTIRAGFEYEKFQYNFTFLALQRGLLVMGSFNDFLVGQSNSIVACAYCTKSGPNGIVHGYRLSNVNSFVQDDYKVSPRLTLNLGVRWEYDGALTDKYGNLTNLWISQLTRGAVATSAATANLAGSGWVVPNNYPQFYGTAPTGVLQNSRSDAFGTHPTWSNFGPRIGLAWQPTGNGKFAVRGGFGMFYDRVAIDRLYHSVEQSAPYAVTVQYSGPNPQTLANPFPATPALGTFPARWIAPNCPTLPGGCGLNSSNLNTPFQNEVSHTPLVRQYNLNVQYEFLTRWVLEVGYVGSSGINLVDFNHNYNTALLASPSNPVNGQTTNTTANVLLRVPYLGFQAAGLQGTAYDGISNYNSLQVTVRKQFSRGFMMQAAYTFSKSLSDVTVNSANSNNASDLSQQYGPTNFNRPHRFVVNYNYDLPFGNPKGALGKLVTGWSVSGVTTFQNGQPLTIADTSGGSVYGESTDDTPGNGFSRAQLCPGKTYADLVTPGGITQRLGGASGGPGYINRAALCAPPIIGDLEPVPGTGSLQRIATGFGNSGIGILSGPGQFNWDFSLVKATRLTERQFLQFRAEFFNAFNHAQFAFGNLSGGPGAGLPNVSSPNFGQVIATSVNPRVIQLALKYSF